MPRLRTLTIKDTLPRTFPLVIPPEFSDCLTALRLLSRFQRNDEEADGHINELDGVLRSITRASTLTTLHLLLTFTDSSTEGSLPLLDDWRKDERLVFPRLRDFKLRISNKEGTPHGHGSFFLLCMVMPVLETFDVTFLDEPHEGTYDELRRTWVGGELSQQVYFADTLVLPDRTYPHLRKFDFVYHPRSYHTITILPKILSLMPQLEELSVSGLIHPFLCGKQNTGDGAASSPGRHGARLPPLRKITYTAVQCSLPDIKGIISDLQRQSSWGNFQELKMTRGVPFSAAAVHEIQRRMQGKTFISL